MRATEIIMKKRGTFVRTKDGKELKGNTVLSAEEIKFIIDGYVNGTCWEFSRMPRTAAAAAEK